MRPIKSFEECINEGIVKKQTPDKSRAKFLIRESEQNYLSTLEMVKKIEITNQNANLFIKSCYDILMELIRAKMLLNGYYASGFGAHEAEVAYLNILGFSENVIRFADQMRFLRNGMLYYGTILDKEYAIKVFGFLKEIYPKLNNL